VSLLVFPTLPGLDIKVSRTPLYKTSIQEASSGAELRASRHTYPRYRYTLDLNFLRSTAAWTEFQTLFGFIGRHMGSFDSFLFTDPEDSTVTAHPFGVGDGTTTQFQLQRSLVPSASLPAAASRSYWPVIGDGYEPVFELNGAASVYVGGTLTTVTILNGLVTFSSAPALAAVLTWTGSFYRRCRLASDEQDAERIVSQIWESKSLELISVK